MKNLYALIFIFSIFNSMAQEYIKTGAFGGSRSDFVHGYSIDNIGDLVICGTFQNTVDFNMAPGDEAILTAVSKYDMYIAKYNIQGNFKWAINMNGDPYEHYYVYSITTDQNNNIYITGFADSWIDLDPSIEEAIVNAEERRVFFIAKYSPLGDYIWGYAMGTDKDINLIGYDVAIDQQSENLFICGTFADTIDFDPSENEYNLTSVTGTNSFLAKYSVEGELIWANGFDYPDVFTYGTPVSIQVDEDNNVYMGGYFEGTYDMDPSSEIYTITSVGQSDGYLSKYDQNGDFLWAFTIGSKQADYIWKFRYLNDKLYTVGSWTDTIDFDPSENTFELTSFTNRDCGFMSIYGTDGSFQSVIGIKGKMIGENGSGAQAQDIDIDSENNIYVIGGFYGTADFDPSDQVVELTSTGGISDRDMYLAKYDQSNNYLWAINAGGLSQENGFHVRANGNENVIAFGYYDGICDFDPSNEDAWIHNNGGHDVFLAWYSQFSGSYITNAQNAIESNISPNPFTNSTALSYELKQPSTIQLSVFNQLGQLVYQHSEVQGLGSQQLCWDAPDQPEGLYYYRLQVGDQVANGKMVKVR